MWVFCLLGLRTYLNALHFFGQPVWADVEHKITHILCEEVFYLSFLYRAKNNSTLEITKPTMNSSFCGSHRDILYASLGCSSLCIIILVNLFWHNVCCLLVVHFVVTYREHFYFICIDCVSPYDASKVKYPSSWLTMNNTPDHNMAQHTIMHRWKSHITTYIVGSSPKCFHNTIIEHAPTAAHRVVVCDTYEIRQGTSMRCHVGCGPKIGKREIHLFWVSTQRECTHKIES